MSQNQPQNVQALVNTWFDTLQWIKDNRAAAITIMAKRAGVSEADYQTYDTGTTIFTRQQNIDAFTPGTTSANLNFQANSIADFLVSSGLADSKPPLDSVVRRPVRPTRRREGEHLMPQHRRHRLGRARLQRRPSAAMGGQRCRGGPGPAGPPRCWPSARRSRALGAGR